MQRKAAAIPPTDESSADCTAMYIPITEDASLVRLAACLSMSQQEGQSLDLMHAKSWINRLGGDLPGPAGTRFMRSFSVKTVGTL